MPTRREVFLATKQVDFAQASFGIVGLDCALPLYVRALVDDGVIGWPRLIAMMTAEPARLVGLDRGPAGGMSGLAVGSVAAMWAIFTFALRVFLPEGVLLPI